MNIKDLIEFDEAARNSKNFDEFEKKFDNVESISNYITKMAEYGQTLVTEKMEEKKFVRMMNVLKSFIIGTMISNGDGASMVFSEISGDLKEYTDTIVLAVIGILAEEEVI